MYTYISRYGRSVNRNKRFTADRIILQQQYLALSFDINKVC